METTASKIIDLCGGVAAVSKMTGRDETQVRRWTYGKDRGGTGGRVPSAVQESLLIAARERGIDLRPQHFFGSVPPLGLAEVAQ